MKKLIVAIFVFIFLSGLSFAQGPIMPPIGNARLQKLPSLTLSLATGPSFFGDVSGNGVLTAFSYGFGRKGLLDIGLGAGIDYQFVADPSTTQHALLGEGTVSLSVFPYAGGASKSLSSLAFFFGLGGGGGWVHSLFDVGGALDKGAWVARAGAGISCRMDVFKPTVAIRYQLLGQGVVIQRSVSVEMGFGLCFDLPSRAKAPAGMESYKPGEAPTESLEDAAVYR